MSGAWTYLLIVLGIPLSLLLIGLAAEYVIIPVWRRGIRRLPERWHDRIEMAPIFAIIFAGISFVIFLAIREAPDAVALFGGLVVAIGGTYFFAIKGWRGGLKSSLSDLASALVIGFLVTLFIVAILIFFSGGHPVPLDERF